MEEGVWQKIEVENVNVGPENKVLPMSRTILIKQGEAEDKA